jgi:hypothetical protein
MTILIFSITNNIGQVGGMISSSSGGPPRLLQDISRMEVIKSLL